MHAKRSSKPVSKALPPTDEALDLNTLRARFQSIIWHSALNSKFPTLDRCEYGWEKDKDLKTLHPDMLPPGTPISPVNF